MNALAAAFTDPVLSGQAVFRAVMGAMARPGTIRPLITELVPPPSLSRGAAAVALSLADFEMPVWLDPPLAANPEIAKWLQFHTGAPITDDPAEAALALIADPSRAPAFDSFALGTMEYPDRSTTVVLQVERLSTGEAFAFIGPGIRGVISVSASPLPRDFAAQFAANRALFPRGIDLLFVTNEAVMALPRSSKPAGGG